ncbi:hypothetical protein LCGC14_2084910 [marine sediment metagenome]|uniref:Uncharacterized protein n=1 Tax=marine sediment metagenome TaxID=412755 RepID=A0A0F9HBI6_9ZZZZ
MANDLFLRMCKEAQDEIASGEKGWREAETNTLLLACFGLLTNHLTHNLARPLWFFASSIFLGIVAYVVFKFMGV